MKNQNLRVRCPSEEKETKDSGAVCLIPAQDRPPHRPAGRSGDPTYRIAMQVPIHHASPPQM